MFTCWSGVKGDAGVRTKGNAGVLRCVALSRAE